MEKALLIDRQTVLAGQRVYFDYNASAPLRPASREAMVAALDEVGNASSVHREGRAARRRIEAARVAVARLVNAQPENVTFTSGGSEANASVLTPNWTRDGEPLRIDHLLVGATEHASVLAGGRFPAGRVTRLPVDGDGLLDRVALALVLDELAQRGERALVSVMLANNETGAIQPIAEIAGLAHGRGALFHSDAVQAAGRIPIDIAADGVDVVTLSAHKLGGPQGAGAIIRASNRFAPAPLIAGGGQERYARAGTENVAAIAGFGAAAEAALYETGRDRTWLAWRDALAAIVADGSRPVTVFSGAVARLPQTLCFGVDGVAAETLVIALDLAGVAVSSGSACSSGKVAPSHVLAAMGVPTLAARSAIRVSFGWETRQDDIHVLEEAWRRVMHQITSGINVRVA